MTQDDPKPALKQLLEEFESSRYSRPKAHQLALQVATEHPELLQVQKQPDQGKPD